MPWPTGDTIPDLNTVQWWCLPVPDESFIRRAVWGALMELFYTSNWEEVGSATPEDVSARMSDFFGAIKRCRPMPIGSVIDWPGGTLPEGWLNCDGASLSAADYPDLFAALGYTWGGSGDNFNLPDLRGRSVVGAGQGAGLTNRVLAATGGEETHQLTTPEIPSHIHSIAGLYLGPTQAGTGANAWVYNGAQTKNTLSTGGGGAHNNMPPFAVVNKIILATL